MDNNVQDGFGQKKISAVDPFSNAEEGAISLGGLGRFQSQQRIREEFEATEIADEKQSNKKTREAYAVWKLCCSESSLPGVPNFINSEGK